MGLLIGLVVIFQVLEITAPVFALAMIGFVWAKRGIPYDIAFVTRLATQIAMPCIIFSTLVRAEISPDAVQEIAVATLTLYGAFAVVFAIGFKLAGLQLRTFLPPSVFNNSGNIGLPIALYAFGQEGLALSIVLFALMVSFQFSLGLWFVAGIERKWEAARQPMVWAGLAGIAASMVGWKPPAFADNSIALIGQMGIPLMVLTLGVSISRIQPGAIARAAVIAILRFVTAGAIGFGVATGLGLTGVAFGVLILQAIMPAPVTNYMIALQYNQEPEEVAGLVVVSTMMSALTIPLTLSLLL